MQEVRGRAGRRGAGLPAQGAAPRTVATAVVAVRASGPPPHGRRAPRPRSGIGPRPRSRARIVGLGSAPPAGQTPTPAGRRARARGPLRAGRPSGAARGPRLPMVRRGSRCGRRCEGIEAPRPGNPSPAEALDSGIPPPAFPPPPTPPGPPPPPQLAPGHRAHLGSSQVPRVLRASWLPKEKPPLAAIKIPPPPESLQ